MGAEWRLFLVIKETGDTEFVLGTSQGLLRINIWLEEFREEIYELGEFLFIISIAVLIYYFLYMSLWKKIGMKSLNAKYMK